MSKPNLIYIYIYIQFIGLVLFFGSITVAVKADL